jgi:hypothetical protein
MHTCSIRVYDDAASRVVTCLRSTHLLDRDSDRDSDRDGVTVSARLSADRERITLSCRVKSWLHF